MADPLTATDIILIAGISGAAGGLVYTCTQLTLRANYIAYNELRTSWWLICLFVLPCIVMGAASGVGLLFFLYFLELLKDENTTKNILFLASGTLIAGIATQRLLPEYTRSISQRLNIVERRSDESLTAISIVEKKTEQSHELAMTASVIAKAQATLSADSPPSERQDALTQVIDQIHKDPLNRTLTISGARLQRRLGDLNSAIAILRSFIERKRAANQVDKDYADASIMWPVVNRNYGQV